MMSMRGSFEGDDVPAAHLTEAAGRFKRPVQCRFPSCQAGSPAGKRPLFESLTIIVT